MMPPLGKDVARDLERTVRPESEAQLEKSRAINAAAEERRKVMQYVRKALNST
jgi:hypothetical protein